MGCFVDKYICIHTLEVLGHDLLNRLVDEVVGFIIIQKQPLFLMVVDFQGTYIYIYNVDLYPNICLETQPSPQCLMFASQIKPIFVDMFDAFLAMLRESTRFVVH